MPDQTSMLAVSMSRTDNREMARLLCAEADEISEHGLTNFYEHTYACLRYGQVNKKRTEDRCGDCPLRRFVPRAIQEEAFPCQHIGEQGWNWAAEQPDLAEQYVGWLLRTAEELESEATVNIRGRTT